MDALDQLDLVVVTRYATIATYVAISLYGGWVWLRSTERVTFRRLTLIGIAATTWAVFYLWLTLKGFITQESVVSLAARLSHFPTMAVFVAATTWVRQYDDTERTARILAVTETELDERLT